MFEDILFSEEKVIEEGYKKGFAIGSSEDSIEGYHLGYHRGAEIGAELGYYKAFIEHYLDDTKKFEHSEKILKDLIALKQSVEGFPRTNIEQVDLFELIEKTRSFYKKICTHLKLKIGNKSEGINF